MTARESQRDWLRRALEHASNSLDPDTRVGSVIVRDDGSVAGAGWNRFPPGVKVTPERLLDRETKLKLMLHAERVAMLAALKQGWLLSQCTLYLASTDDTGAVWGGPPCSRCMGELVEAGLRRVVSHPQKAVSKWAEDLAVSRQIIIAEAEVSFTEIPF